MSDTLYYKPHGEHQIPLYGIWAEMAEMEWGKLSCPIPDLPEGMSLFNACLSSYLVCEDDEGNKITPELQSEWVSCENCNCGNLKDEG